MVYADWDGRWHVVSVLEIWGRRDDGGLGAEGDSGDGPLCLLGGMNQGERHPLHHGRGPDGTSAPRLFTGVGGRGLEDAPEGRSPKGRHGLPPGRTGQIVGIGLAGAPPRGTAFARVGQPPPPPSPGQTMWV